jgi:hypothetical protein
MLNPEGSLHGGCAAFLIDAYVLYFRHLQFPGYRTPRSPFLFEFFFCLGVPFGDFVYSLGVLWVLNRCTTLVFLAAARCAGVSASMNVVYHAPAAP